MEHGLAERDKREAGAVVDAAAGRGRDPVPDPSVGLEEMGT
jgi:hypothetical protein